KKEMMARGQSFDPKIPVGIMIEVPAAVLLADLLIQECDFFSIGTNDLIQYTLAVDRNNEQVSQFYEPLHPAVLSSLSRVVRIAREAGKSVSVCGEMAGDPLMAALFIGFGVTHLSMIPSNIPRVKQALLQIEMVKAKIMAEKIVRAATIQEARALLQ
ncbi:MAG: diguanylate phosphodiesterase, partial [Deltaproteobacteria bacterium]|nr:diguanylate phosphodiesterase [Deltaproteobacteria bacterium]